MRLQSTKLKLLAAAQDLCAKSGRCDGAADGQLLEQLLATTVQVGADTITLQPGALSGAFMTQGTVRPGAVFDRGAAQVNALTDARQAVSKQGMPLGEVMGGLEGQGPQGVVLEMLGDRCLYMTRV